MKQQNVFPDLNQSPNLSLESQKNNIINNIKAIEDPGLSTRTESKDLFKTFGIDPDTKVVSEESKDSINPVIINNSSDTLKNTDIENFISDDYSYNPEDPIDFDGGSDVIKLPSEGKIYPHKKGKLNVAYLNASDEDLLSTTNLYKNGTLIPILMRKKVLNTEIEPSTLCNGDIEYLMIWLRCTAYGPMYSVNVTTGEGKQFETQIDLSKLKIKHCVDEPDENGYFTFDTKVKKYGKILYKILSYSEEKHIEKLILKQGLSLNEHVLFSEINDLKNHIDKLPEEMNGKYDLITLYDKTLSFFNKHLSSTKNVYQENITSYLYKQIVSINGVKDPNEIKKMIKYMPVALSRELRAKIRENTPGIDYEVEVQVPGGEPIKTFLQIGPDILWGLD